MPATFAKVAAVLAIGSWALFSVSCSPTLATIGLEAAADSMLLAQGSLANMAASGQGDPEEIARASGQLSVATKTLWRASDQVKGGLDALTVAQIIQELSSVATMLVPAPWGPLIAPLISAVYSAVELIIHHLKGPGGLAPRLAGASSSMGPAKPIKVSMGDRAVLSRVVQKLQQADAISEKIPGRYHVDVLGR